MDNERVLTIQELEAEMESRANFGSGITVASGFDLGAKAALDSRATVKTLAERDAHVTGNRAYEGMLVFVEADKKTYQYVNSAWKEFGFNGNDFQAGIVNDLTTGGTTKALSAEQGKVLKGLVDKAQGEVDALETKHASEMSAANAAIATKAEKSYVDGELAKKAALAGNLTQDFNAKNVVVAGNLTVQGTTTTIDSTDLQVKDNEIVINKGETGAGVSKGTAGIRVERGTAEDYLFHFDEQEDMFKVGMEGDLETVATRPWVNTQISSVNTEVAKKANQTDLEAEVTRAKGEEGKIRTEFAAADTALSGRITANDTAIKAEVTRATGIEAGLRTDVNAKVAKTQIKNTLTETVAGNVLDAAQGKVLNDKIVAEAGKVSALAGRMDTAEASLGTVDSRIATAKAGAVADAKTYTDTVANGKANKVHEHAIADVTGLQTKLTSIDGEISGLKSADTAMGGRVDALETATADLGQIRQDISANASAISTEAGDRAAADTALGQRIDATNIEVGKKADQATMTTELAKKVDKTFLLDGSNKINASLIPALALTETFVVASESAMLALVAQPGDIAIRTDQNKTYILKTAGANTLANWAPLLTPASDVTSVNGMKGDVTLTKSHVGLGNVTNESKATMFTSPAFTGVPTAPTAAASTNTTQVATTAFVKAQGYLTGESIIDGGTF